MLVPLNFETAPALCEATLENFYNAIFAAAASAKHIANHTGPLAAKICNDHISFAQIQAGLYGTQHSTTSSSALDSFDHHIPPLNLPPRRPHAPQTALPNRSLDVRTLPLR